MGVSADVQDILGRPQVHNVEPCIDGGHDVAVRDPHDTRETGRSRRRVVAKDGGGVVQERAGGRRAAVAVLVADLPEAELTRQLLCLRDPEVFVAGI